MALIKLGALAQDVRGSLNGTTYSRNRGGAYVRSKVSPVQPISPASSASRQAFKDASQSWSSQLTDTERGSWIAFAATHPFINVFGDSIVLSGIAFFQAANKRLAGIGFPMIADAPITWDVTPPGIIAPVATVNTSGVLSLLINPDVATSGPNISAYLFATTKIPNGARPQRNQYRLVNPQDATVRNETYDWGIDYQARFSPYTPAEGDKLGILYAYIDTDNGCISVSSNEVTIAVTLPGPLINVVSKIKLDAGAGNIQPILSTEVPHGLTGGDQITVALSPTDADIDGTDEVVGTVVSETQFYLSSRPGTPAGFTTTAGTIQRTL